MLSFLTQKDLISSQALSILRSDLEKIVDNEIKNYEISLYTKSKRLNMHEDYTIKFTDGSIEIHLNENIIK